MNNKFLLIGGVSLILLGLLQPNLSIPGLISRPSVVDYMELPEPKDPSLKKEAEDVLKVMKEYGSESRNDARKLRDLYLDMSKLISLDGDEEVIKSTEEIRQANSIAGPMLRLDIKGKYSSLAKEAKEVVVSAVGDDQILLSPELREKAAEAFNALAWALNEGSK